MVKRLHTVVETPVFLLAAFAKNAKVSLSESERQALMKAAKGIVAQYGRQKR